jgi:hypothetical protein
MSFLPNSAGPRAYPSNTLIIPSGTSASVLVAPAGGITIGSLINAAAVASVGISVYNSATVGGIAAANRVLNAEILGASSNYPLNVYFSAGCVIQFASALTDNLTVTYTPKNGGS